MYKFMILGAGLLLPLALFSQAIDTLWSVPQLDGTICYRPGSGIFNMDTFSTEFIPGDAFDDILGEDVFCRDFLSFDLSQLANADTSSIVSATVGVYQLNAFGNDQLNTYPIWNVAGGDTHFCVLDHIDYGSNLDLGDWTAGDPGDMQTLQTNIGIISDDAMVEYKTMDVTRYIKGDISYGRNFNQYRMRFTIDTDFDGLADFLFMVSGNAQTYPRPFVAIQYSDSTLLVPISNVPFALELKQNYPNPFNPVTMIAYTLPKAGMAQLIIFDLTGRKVQTLLNSVQFAGSYEVQFDGSHLPSGVYWYSLTFEKQISTKKMILIR